MGLFDLLDPSNAPDFSIAKNLWGVVPDTPEDSIGIGANLTGMSDQDMLKLAAMAAVGGAAAGAGGAAAAGGAAGSGAGGAGTAGMLGGGSAGLSAGLGTAGPTGGFGAADAGLSGLSMGGGAGASSGAMEGINFASLGPEAQMASAASRQAPLIASDAGGGMIGGAPSNQMPMDEFSSYFPSQQQAPQGGGLTQTQFPDLPPNMPYDKSIPLAGAEQEEATTGDKLKEFGMRGLGRVAGSAFGNLVAGPLARRLGQKLTREEDRDFANRFGTEVGNSFGRIGESVASGGDISEKDTGLLAQDTIGQASQGYHRPSDAAASYGDTSAAPVGGGYESTEPTVSQEDILSRPLDRDLGKRVAYQARLLDKPISPLVGMAHQSRLQKEAIEAMEKAQAKAASGGGGGGFF